mgnify:CR=1 FL=1
MTEHPDSVERFRAALKEHGAEGDVVRLDDNAHTAQAAAEGLGITAGVSSPTFVLARTYNREPEPDLVHADAYRLTSAAELDDLDIDFANSISVIEWGKGFIEGLTDHWLEVEIDRTSGDSEARQVRITGQGERWGDLNVDLLGS